MVIDDQAAPGTDSERTATDPGTIIPSPSEFIVSFASERQVAETSVEAAGDGDHVLATATSATGLLTQAIQLIQVCAYTPVPEYGMGKRVAFRRSIL